MKIVLLGATGQVGRELSGLLPAQGDLVACDRGAADLERPAEVVTLLARERPDVIVNAAAYTAVDRAESEPDRAEMVNAKAVAAIAAEAARQDALLVHYSTDYVFDGTSPGCRGETDEPRPLSVYGATKLAGERAIAAAGCRHWVFRTSWVYASHGTNFVRTIIRLAGERDELAVVADQTGAPTSAGLVARVTGQFLERLATAPPECGLYHLAPRGSTTWHGFARFILQAAHAQGMPLRVPPEAVRPIPTEQYPTAARRPANSLLCTAKLETALAERLANWQDDAASTVAAIAAALR